VDDHKTQCDFAAQHASFPMIGDSKKVVVKQFGVLWPVIGKARRVTFVIDAEGVIKGAFSHEIRIEQHIADVLEMLKKL
jgi:thioredoxin-dependent peroxiredoxin